MPTLSVVGAGVIGLAVAWRAAEAGWQVTLHGPATGRSPSSAAGARHSASWVAGGMLAPLTEGRPGPAAALTLGSRSLAIWPEFAADLERLTGGPSGLRPDGTLVVGFDQADLSELTPLAIALADQGRVAHPVDAQQARELEPMLSHRVAGGLDVPGDLSVDNRALLVALDRACQAAGVIRETSMVADTARLSADQVVVAAGVWSPALCTAAAVIRPVKGEILRLRRRPGTPAPPRRTIRALLNGRHVYVVPREDSVAVGATQRDTGFDDEVTANAIRELIADAESALPELGDYGLIEATAGLRPMTPDGLPLIGRVDARTVLASGHGRDGILLTPITAEAVVAELNGHPSATVAAADPARFG